MRSCSGVMGNDSPFVCRFRLIQSLHVSEQGQSDLIEYVKSVYSLLWIATPSNLQFKRYIVTRYNKNQLLAGLDRNILPRCPNFFVEVEEDGKWWR